MEIDGIPVDLTTVPVADDRSCLWFNGVKYVPEQTSHSLWHDSGCQCACHSSSSMGGVAHIVACCDDPPVRPPTPPGRGPGIEGG